MGGSCNAAHVTRTLHSRDPIIICCTMIVQNRQISFIFKKIRAKAHILRGRMKESYLFKGSEGVVDIVALGLINFFTFFFSWYWEPPGLLLPLIAL